MANAVLARQRGDAFQARIFWLHASELLKPGSGVERVAFEIGPKGFDDIVLHHARTKPRRDHEDRPVYVEFIQCKWHVRAGTFGHADLIDPDFVGGASFSFLERALAAQVEHAPEGHGCQFRLVTNWRLRHDDPLIELVSKNSDTIDLGRLYEGATDRSRMGAVRKLWREHLGIDDEALSRLARTLVIAETPESLEALCARLDDRFLAVGMTRVPRDRAGHAYDGLPGQLQGRGRVEFDRSGFREMCRREGLLEGGEPAAQPLTVGVRSFMHPIDDIEARCDRVLNLVPHFEGRYIRRDADWADLVHPALRRFLLGAAREAGSLRLVLDAHASLAFAAGAVLDVKSGRRVKLEQRTDERRFWSADDLPSDPAWADWEVWTETVAGGSGHGVALAVSLTHDVGDAVRAHLDGRGRAVGTIMHAQPAGGPSQQSVACGRHAWKLAEALVARARPLLERGGSGRHAHLFFAGPNALAFFLGRLHQALGPATIYEWDFDGLRGGGYRAGITVS